MSKHIIIYSLPDSHSLSTSFVIRTRTDVKYGPKTKVSKYDNVKTPIITLW